MLPALAGDDDDDVLGGGDGGGGSGMNDATDHNHHHHQHQQQHHHHHHHHEDVPVERVALLGTSETVFVRTLPGNYEPEAPSCFRSLHIVFFIIIYIGYVAVLVGAGMVAHSLALLSESIHAFSDLVSYSIGLWLHFISYKQATPSFPFGYGRTEVVGGLVSAVFLLAGAVFIIIEAVQKMFGAQEEVNAEYVILLGCCGLGVNITGAVLMHNFGTRGMGGHGHSHGLGGGHAHAHDDDDDHGSGGGQGGYDDDGSAKKRAKKVDNGHFGLKSQNIYGMFLHLLVDCLSSSVVLISGLLEKYSVGKHYHRYLDPIGGLLIATLILCLSIPLLKECAMLVLQTPPPHLNLNKLLNRLLAVPGVQSVLKLTVWRLGDRDNTLVATATVSVDSALPSSLSDDGVVGGANAMMTATFASQTSVAIRHNQLLRNCKHVLHNAGSEIATVEILYDQMT